ncbi:MAG: autotransporter-associated beta strand repeat-containing protein, partial [Cyclobacteriaceae bacterium]|nr:autotransporter-associated beta strand repeat-containing protein [Cyclobacteriaceae bacterium]
MPLTLRLRSYIQSVPFLLIRPSNRLLPLLAAFLLVLLSASLSEAQKTWLPTTGGVWTTGANWSGGTPPVAGDDVIINSDQSANITAVPNISLGDLTLSGNCTLAGPSGNVITVTGMLTVASGKTIIVGAAGVRLSMLLSSTGIGTISGTLLIDSFGGQPRFFQNDGDLTMTASGIITDDGANDSDFILSSGATLRIGSLSGITAATISGNIQVGGTRSFSTGANYHYVGTAAQATGNGLPATVSNLTINNPGGTVSLTTTTSVTNQLTVPQGTFSLAGNNITSVGALNMTGSTISGGGTITLAGDVTTNAAGTPATISANIDVGGGTRTFFVDDTAAVPDLNISGIISGTGGIIKEGIGSMNLSNAANGYSGSTTANTGILRINAGGGAIPNSSALVINSTLDLNGNNEIAGSLAGTGTVRSGVAGTLTLTVGGDNTSTTFSGVIQNGSATSIGITKNGTGAFTLSGANTYSGITLLSGGAININSATALGTGTFTIAGGNIDNTSGGPITLTNNNLQNWNSNFSFLGSNPLNLGTGAVTLNANRQVTTDASTLTVGGVIGGAFRLTKAGAGELALNGANTYSGTTLNAGILSINNTNALGNVGSAFIINGGSIDNTTGGTVTTASYPQNWNGDFTFIGTQSLRLGAGNVTLGGNRLVTTNANTLTVGGVIAGGFSLAKAGAGALSLSGANTFSGGTTLNAGTLNINDASALGAVGGTFTINGGTIDNTSGGAITTVNYPQTWGGDFSFTGTNNLNLGTGAVSLSGNRQVTVDAGTLTVGGVISAPTFNLTKAGAGTLLLGSNAVTLNSLAINAGTFTATSGTLTLSGSLTNSGTFGNNGGTVHYNGGGAQTVAGVNYHNLVLSGAGQKTASGNVSVANNFTNSSVFDLGVNTLSVTGTLDNTLGEIRFSGASNGIAINTGAVRYYGAAQTIGSGIYQNLIIDQSAGVAVLGGAVTVNGTLTVSNGSLNLNGYNLTLGPAATISIVPSATRMIIASAGDRLIKTFSGAGSFVFPIGDNVSTSEYSPISINVTAGGGFPATVGVTVYDAKHPNNASTANYLTRYWDVQTDIVGGVADISATYTVSDVVGAVGSISSGQLPGTFNQLTNPWIKFSTLVGTTLTANGSSLSQTPSDNFFTGITGASPVATIVGGGVTVCSGTPVNLNTNVVGGDPAYSYSWSPATGLSATNIANPTATLTANETYTVTVRDANGIVDTDVTTITVNVLPAAPTIISSGSTICDGINPEVTLTSSAAPGGGTYIWYKNGAPTGDISASIAISDPVGSGVYTVSVVHGVTGCISPQSVGEAVTINALPDDKTVAPTSATTVCDGGTVTLQITGSQSGINYELVDQL